MNHYRVYLVLYEENLMSLEHGNKMLDARKHDGKVSVKESDARWYSEKLGLSCDNGERVRVVFALDCCDREVMTPWWLPTNPLIQHWWVA